MIDYSPLLRSLSDSPLESWRPELQARLSESLGPGCHGDFERWQQVLDQLPVLQPDRVLLDGSAVGAAGAEHRAQELQAILDGLHPWRKGPFYVHGVEIDTEWRSDWKWDRLAPHIDPLDGRLVLDIGCGNGYHCWRMAGAGVRLAIGIDPTLLFVMQFFALRHFIADDRAWVLPLGIEQLPQSLSGFDTVFSMGVLYHRRSPIEHLERLWSLLRPGGQLVLETLIVDGGPDRVLVPSGRYARMRNTVTTVEEQRSTPWMRFESLDQCLDADNPDLTIEGYPAPRRAIFLANKPT
jgi:tRNA (mo5U34)-methyltransferase